jgi:hypothetical protein
MRFVASLTIVGSSPIFAPNSAARVWTCFSPSSNFLRDFSSWSYAIFTRKLEITSSAIMRAYPVNEGCRTELPADKKSSGPALNEDQSKRRAATGLGFRMRPVPHFWVKPAELCASMIRAMQKKKAAAPWEKEKTPEPPPSHFRPGSARAEQRLDRG